MAVKYSLSRRCEWVGFGDLEVDVRRYHLRGSVIWDSLLYAVITINE